MSKKGITLISLIIIVSVMLIIAGVAIGAMTGDDSTIDAAERAVSMQQKKEIQEKIASIAVKMEERAIKEKRDVTKEDIATALYEAGIIDAESAEDALNKINGRNVTVKIRR